MSGGHAKTVVHLNKIIGEQLNIRIHMQNTFHIVQTLWIIYPLWMINVSRRLIIVDERDERDERDVQLNALVPRIYYNNFRRAWHLFTRAST